MKVWGLLGILAVSIALPSATEAKSRRKSKASATQSSTSARAAMAKLVGVLENGEDKDLLPFISQKGVRVNDDGRRETISYKDAKAVGLHGFFAPGAIGMNNIFMNCQWKFKLIAPNTFAPDASKATYQKEMTDPKRIYVKWKREGKTWKIEEYAFPLVLTG